MSSSPSHTSYDAVPYPSHPRPQTHPDRLATVATLLGLRPPPPDRCRVLELGCAGGGNLIPLALALPESTFVGVDLSAAQVAQGQKVVDALGLANIQLRQLSILDVDESFGPFDYVLCHGVYSWVPEPVQDKILDICARHLTPGGIGFISYNTYPGWHLRGLVRDMLCYHVRRFPHEPPARRVGRARALLDFLARAAVETDPTYRSLLREQQELFQKVSDAYLFHEHLEECNTPVWFLEFCERLAAKGLRYLGEAEFHSMLAATSFPAAVQEELDALTRNLVEKEQYMDFLRNRSFRQTLVCHDRVLPNYEIRPSRLRPLHVASPVRPQGTIDLESGAPAVFEGRDGLTLTVAAPVVKAALAHLGEVWPRALPFDALCELARARLGDAPAPEDAHALGLALLMGYASGGESLAELWLRPPPFVTALGDRPAASPLARLQAADGHQVASLRHEVVTLTPFDRHLLPHLDGTHDRAGLLAALEQRFRQGLLQITEDDRPVRDPARARQVLAEVLERQLPKYARAGLLVR